MPKRDILKRSPPYYNEDEVLDKAEELERRAKNLHKIEDDFDTSDEFSEAKAKLYEKAAQHYLNAKKPKKAVNCYESAAKIYDSLSEFYSGKQMGVKTGPITKKEIAYANLSNKDLKNAERLKKSLKGKWHGLEGKAISAILGIGGILGAIFMFSGEITGNAVGNISSQSSNIFGGILFLIGIVGCFNYFRNKK